MTRKAKTTGAPASVSEVLERVLDRGIVIDAWLRVSVAGITLLDVDARIVVASIETYVQHSESLAQAPLASRPGRRQPRPQRARGRTAAAAPHWRVRPPVELRCESGCTFRRSTTRAPATVRCPSDRGRTCPVTVLTV
jgi:hypothetical protein